MTRLHRITRLSWFIQELQRKFGNKWTETPIVVCNGKDAYAYEITSMVWNSKYKRIELRTQVIRDEVYPTSGL